MTYRSSPDQFWKEYSVRVENACRIILKHYSSKSGALRVSEIEQILVACEDYAFAYNVKKELLIMIILRGVPVPYKYRKDKIHY